MPYSKMLSSKTNLNNTGHLVPKCNCYICKRSNVMQNHLFLRQYTIFNQIKYDMLHLTWTFWERGLAWFVEISNLVHLQLQHCQNSIINGSPFLMADIWEVLAWKSKKKGNNVTSIKSNTIIVLFSINRSLQLQVRYNNWFHIFFKWLHLTPKLQ